MTREEKIAELLRVDAESFRLFNEVMEVTKPYTDKIDACTKKREMIERELFGESRMNSFMRTGVDPVTGMNLQQMRDKISEDESVMDTDPFLGMAFYVSENPNRMPSTRPAPQPTSGKCVVGAPMFQM